MRGPKKFLLIFGGAQVFVISALLLHARALQIDSTTASDRLRVLVLASNPQAKRIELLKDENERIRKDLAQIPTLREESRRIESQMAAESAAEIAFWAAQTNQLQAAVEQSRRHIAEIEAWEENDRQMKMRERAAARLAERAAENSSSSGDASDQYRKTEASLKQIADRMNKQLVIRRDFDASEKTPENRAAFQAKMGETWNNLDSAMKQLGKDIDLFEELPVKPADANSRTPIFRSVIPDLRGVTATLYLDGTVEWSPPLEQPLKK